MKLKIRNNIFETNSSSVHAICIKKDYKLKDSDIFKYVSFSRNDFGWEPAKYCCCDDKISYLFEMCLDEDGKNKKINFTFTDDDHFDYKILSWEEDSCCARLLSFLQKRGIDVQVCFPILSDGGYIDHCECWGDTIEILLNNEEELESFIFSKDSFVLTGNDNCYDEEKAIPLESDSYIIYDKYN